MWKNRKLTSIILLSAIAASCIGCQSDLSNDNTGLKEIDESSVSEETTVIEEYTLPNVDYGGRTVTFTGYAYEGSWAILRYNIAIDEETGDIINDAIVKRNRAVEGALNVNIELIPLTVHDRNSSAVLQKYIMAQEDAVTVGMQMSAGLSPLLTTDGMLINLKDIPTLDLSHSWWNQNANEEYTLYGNQYAAVGDICLFNLGAPVVVYFSKEMVKDNKLDDPYQLVYDGKWTIDQMSKMAKDVARDANGNSTVDVEDIFGFAGENDSLSYTLFSAGVRYSSRDNSGNIQPSLNTEKTIAIADAFVPLLRDKQTSIYTGDWEKNYPEGPFVGLMVPKLTKNELLFFSNQLHVSLSMRDMESDFGILPMPKYDEAQENYISIANTWFSDHIVIPSTNTDLEMTGHLLDAMGYYAKEYITPAFIDYSVKNKGARDEDSVNMINLILENQIFDVGLIFNWGDTSGMLASMIKNANPSFASVWAANESKISSEIADTVSTLKNK